ncbi:hypothetical protein A3K93_00845 [Acinetobacter sp. NCu2D-2]|uniref:hypothetical protein n=1 Tax=Acinetobacter sp. NCu2D-2 TaxID=1608473 RepID=UPI0007CE0C28|nr:hypothetical protein [Acinetobacter sp. NCu2D-2]ANF80874.1 hypothetical protein A3K93_00845 [Acinetobacter sp. NCu2D-2]
MKILAISAALLLALGLSACSKDKTENTESTNASEPEVTVDQESMDEEPQPLDAAPLETDDFAASETVAQ